MEYVPLYYFIFDSVGNFKNPTTSVVMRQHVCEYCSSTHDLDLGAPLTNSNSDRLSCQNCSQDYDMNEIEDFLIETLQTTLTQWQTQVFNLDIFQ